MALGSVERVLVLGIVVVIVAILGIAVWGATGDDPGAPALAADGGASVGAPGVGARVPQGRSQFQPMPLPGATQPAAGAQPGAVALGAQQPKPSGTAPAPISEIERWKQLREADKAQRAAEAGGVTPAPLASGELAPSVVTPGAGALPGAAVEPAGASAGNAPAVPLKNNVAEAGSVAQPAKPTPVEPKASTYTVVNGDSLWKIAVKQYGDSNIQEHVDALVAANPSIDPDNLKIGAKLTLPSKQTSVNRLPAKEQAKLLDSGLYEVKKGDTLSSIAKKQLGDSNRWREIYDLNRERIADPSMLFAGTALRLPKS